MSLPADILADSYRTFCSGIRADDQAALSAMSVFLRRVDNGSFSHAKARKLLADDQKLSNFIEKVRVQHDKDNISKESSKEAAREARLARIEQHLVKHGTALESLDTRHTADVATLKQHTDPDTNKKSSFWVNMKAGAIYFIAALVAGPVGAILLKKPLEGFDQFINGEKPAVPSLPVSAPSNPTTSQSKGPVLELIDPATGKPTNVVTVNENLTILVTHPPNGHRAHGATHRLRKHTHAKHPTP